MSAAEYQETAIWRRVIRPNTTGWSRAAAEAILHLEFQPEDQARMLELLARNGTGEITPEESEELENFRNVGTTLELLQSRARLSLKALAAG